MVRAPLRGILFDLDGVLYVAERLIDGAVETVRWAGQQRIPHLFVTNTTSHSRAALVVKLAGFGIAASESRILTPAAAAAEWLREHGAGDIALFVQPITRPEFDGLACLAGEAERGAQYVVIGDLAEGWDFRTLNRAFRLLHHNPEAVLIALGMTRYWLASDGITLDVAPFVAALEYASGRNALVFGKPARNFFYAAADRLEMLPEQILMVGDDAEVDISGAQAAGLRGALVKTGKFRPSDLEGPARPYVILDSVAGLPAWWQR
ncbi:MAG: TIGR01458 family HAD-type hydrolase [Acidobacteria bacterium]|nr:TIGR01458 family HAD-type hydrolase [Acidobacteriota bacterium]